MAELAILLPEALAGGGDRRERFIKLIRDAGPRGSAGGVEPLTISEDRAEASFAVNFSWRGDFGVERRKVGHFLGIMHRDAVEWRFQGARLLDAVP